jgi:hypothetical protein
MAYVVSPRRHRADIPYAPYIPLSPDDCARKDVDKISSLTSPIEDGELFGVAGSLGSFFAQAVTCYEIVDDSSVLCLPQIFRYISLGKMLTVQPSLCAYVFYIPTMLVSLPLIFLFDVGASLFILQYIVHYVTYCYIFLPINKLFLF